MSKLVPNSPNGEHCSTCRFRVPTKTANGVFHYCHGGPPALLLLASGAQGSAFTFVNPDDPNAWCGQYKKRRQARRR